MKKTLISKDQNENRINREKWEKERADVQKVVNLYNTTKLPKLAGNELNNLLNDTLNFLYDKMTGGEAAHLTIGKGNNATQLPVVKSKAIDILQKPRGYNELLNGVTVLVKGVERGNYQNEAAHWTVAKVSEIFDLDEKGNVKFTDKHSAALDEFGNRYITGDKANRLYAFAQAVVKAYYDNEIEKTGFPGTGDHKPDIGAVINGCIDKLPAPGAQIVVADDLFRFDNVNQ